MSVFGRGIGEAIAVHVGDGRWITVDSCLGSGGGQAQLDYLTGLGFDPAKAVTLAVVSHWDSDHITGLAELVKGCAAAEFACAATLQDPELVKEICKRGRTRASEPGRRNVDQFAQVFKTLAARKRTPAYGLRGTVLWESDSARAWSLSPSGGTHARSLLKLVRNAARGEDAAAGVDRENHLSMVLYVEAGERSLLLGGDLERLTAWQAVLASPGRRGARASAYKVAHHGSENGDHDLIWADLLTTDAPAAVTSFTRHGLPTADDLLRLGKRTGNVFLAGQKVDPIPRDDELVAQIAANTSSAGTKPLTGGLGHVRMRAPLSGSGPWSVQTFGNAARVA